MKRFKSFAIMVLLAVSSAVMAQNTKTTVKGTLVDPVLGEGEPFATARIFKKGTTEKPVAMFLTDDQGHFSHEVEATGDHDLVFSCVGKEELKVNLSLDGRTVIDLDTLYVKQDAKMLGTVEVVAMKPLVKMEVDKMSYNVEDDADSKTATVLDMLRKVPMVTVDGQDNISVNGSSSFQIYVDGKPNVMFSSNPSMIFKSMPASAVKNIEVITNPGARYDAEGAAGVLNIVMNRQNPKAMESLNGFNGTLRASVGNRAVGGGAFVSGQQGKLSFSANLMEQYTTPGSPEVETEQMNGGGTIIGHAKTDTKVPFTMGNVNLGYDIDSVSTMSASASITSMNMKSDMSYITNMQGGSYGSGYSYGTDTDTKNKRTSFSGSVDYQRFFNRERTSWMALTYQLNYSPMTMESTNLFDSGSTSFVDLTDRYSINKEKTTDHTVQFDYTTPLGKGQTLSLGSKLMTRRATSDAKYYLSNVYDESSSMDYVYKNTILAGYAEYAATMNKIGAKLGLRYEHTWQDVEYKLGKGADFETDYGSLVPTANLSYNISMTSNIGLTYNMRISRPGISYLNPYVDKSSPVALSYGNTDLDVEKTHNISLVYNMFSPKLMLNLNLHHNFTDNAIASYSFYDGNLLNTTYGNIVERKQTGANVYANWLAAKNTRLFTNASLNYVDMNSDVLNENNSGWQYNAMLGLQQTLPWNLKLSTFLMSSSKSYTLQGWSSGFQMANLSLSKSLLNDKLNISVSGMMGLSDGGKLKMETYSEGSNFNSRQTIKIPMAGVTLSVSYTFGNSKRQPKQHVSRVTNDYIEQQSQGEMLNSIGSGNSSQQQQQQPILQ